MRFIEFAPLFVPLGRRLQTLAVVCFVFVFLNNLSVLGAAALIYLLFTKFYWLTLAYLAFYVYDRSACETGGYDVPFVRKLRIWTWFRDYFPVSLIKTSDLDPTRNYLFCAHPHGIMCSGIVCSFATDACGFSEKFPGLRPHLLALRVNFLGPITREHNLLYGINVASKKALDFILNNRGKCAKPGQACILIVGGVEEVLNVRPNTYVLTIKNRKGFIKAALQSGSSLVPVFSFGENDLYQTYTFNKGSFVRSIQERLKKWTTYGFPVIVGRGMFNYTFGPLPHRRPINVVVGKPIDVVKTNNPTNDQVDRLHERYICELTALFEQHKANYIHDQTTSLVFQ
jgi:2-acylglycerol O-acyltransferase 2